MNSFGTDEYITETVSEYTQPLFKVAYTLLHNHSDAQDAVQEVFIKLITKKPFFFDKEHEKAWLIRVTLNTSKNLLKKRSREYADDSIDCEAYSENTEQSEVLDAVMSLDEKYRTVIHLYYYEEMSISQIAKTLRIPSATVGTRLSRGRAILKEKLKGDVTL